MGTGCHQKAAANYKNGIDRPKTSKTCNPLICFTGKRLRHEFFDGSLSSGTVFVEAVMIALNLFQLPPQGRVRCSHPVPSYQKQHGSHTAGDDHKRDQKD